MLTCPKCRGTGQIEDPASIGSRLRRQRITARITLREMARRLSVSSAYLSEAELGHTTLTPERLHQYQSIIASVSPPNSGTSTGNVEPTTPPITE